MANHDSAIKKNKADLKKRLRNRSHRTRLRSQVKKLRQAIDQGDAPAAEALLRETLSIVDRTARLGVIHDNTASRTKARLTRACSKLSASN